MAQRRNVVAETHQEELLRLAAERVKLPKGTLRLKYQPDVDLLAIRLKQHPQPTHSKDDQERGLIFNYEGRALVSIEVLDLYGTFVN
jgi:hypothetical protein